MDGSLFPQSAPPEPIDREICLISWNLLHGGGRRIPEIALVLADARPDIVVLTEFRAGSGGALRAVLADHGLTHHLTDTPHARANTLLIACRHPLRRIEIDTASRVIHAFIERWNLALTAAHLPCDLRSDPRFAQLQHAWLQLVNISESKAYENHVLVGDLNTDRSLARGARTGASAFRLGQLATRGYVDAFLHLGGDPREHSWTGPRDERARLDHTLVSRALAPRLITARYLRDALDRGVSDHAPMLVRLATTTPPERTD